MSEQAGSGAQSSLAEPRAAAEAYGDLIGEQLKREFDTKQSLEQRGTWVLTSSAALVTLLFSLTAGLLDPPNAPRTGLLIALLLFTGAALLGLMANIPLPYGAVSIPSLQRLNEGEFWGGPYEIGFMRAHEARIGIIETARRSNRIKAWILIAAFGLEVAALVSLTITLSRLL